MPTTTTPTADLQQNLMMFTGTEARHRASGLSTRLQMTDGVKYLCDAAQCYWLMDIIASYQPQCNKDEMLKYFQIWTLTVEGNSGKVICERDTDDIAIQQDIEHTSFPMDSIKLYCIDDIILLPSEY